MSCHQAGIEAGRLCLIRDTELETRELFYPFTGFLVKPGYIIEFQYEIGFRVLTGSKSVTITFF